MKTFLYEIIKNISILDLLPFRTFSRSFLIRKWLHSKRTKIHNHITNKQYSTNMVHSNKHPYQKQIYLSSCKEHIIIYIIEQNVSTFHIHQIALIPTMHFSKNISIHNETNTNLIKPYFKCTLLKTLYHTLYSKHNYIKMYYPFTIPFCFNSFLLLKYKYISFD